VRVRKARLALIVAAGQVLRNGLGILGIAAPNEM
jgi:arginyl-tRNA synthetase